VIEIQNLTNINRANTNKANCFD